MARHAGSGSRRLSRVRFDVAMGVPAQAFSVSGFLLLRSACSHGGTANFGVFEGVNKETGLESSVPDNQQKDGSPKLTSVGGSHGKGKT